MKNNKRIIDLRKARATIYLQSQKTEREKTEDSILNETITSLAVDFNDGWFSIKRIAEVFSKKIGFENTPKKVGYFLTRNGFIERKAGAGNCTLVLLKKVV